MVKARNPLLVLIWSLGLYLLVHTTQYVGCFAASAISGASFESIISGKFSNHLTQLGQGVTAGVVGIPFLFFVARFLWRRPWSWVRLHVNVKFLSYGLLFGIGVAALSLLTVGLFGNVRVVASPDRFKEAELASVVLGTLGWVAFIAVLEEFIFRGIAVREWATRWGWPVATLLGGIYFGCIHVIGLLPNISIIEVLWIVVAAITANMLFVALYVRSKSLWLPIGFHAGWNLSLETLFGVTMSGQDSPYALYSIEISGRDSVTGGVFGIEGSVVVMVIWIIISLVVLRYSRSGKPDLMNSGLGETT